MKIGKHQLTPSQLATSVWSNLGARGSGKTNAAGVVAEGIMDAGIPVIVIDQVGVWFGLRLKPDGKTPSRFKLPILGGAHGDIPLEPGSGRQVAEALAASQSSAILDVSQLRKGERARFCADFAEAFLHAKKSAASAVCVILEEAQEVVPQMMRFTSPDLSRCLGAFEDIASMGRNFGIGLGLLSLRPQKINKELLNLSETVFAFRMGGPSERKAVAEWVQEKGAPGREDVAGELPSLPRGTAILWSPGLFGIYDRVALPLKSTYDASSTPGAGRADVKTSPLDLAALQKAMATVVAEAKANDPRALKAEVADLRRQLAAKPGAAPVPVKPPSLPKSDLAAIQKHTAAQQALTKATEKHTAATDALAALWKANWIPMVINVGPADGQIVQAGLPTPPRAPSGFVPNPAPRVAAPSEPGSFSLGTGGATRILRALAETLKDGLSRRELGALSDLKSTSGTFDTYLSRLRGEGLIENGGAGIRITEAGRAQVGPVEKRTGKQLLDHWVPRLGGKPGGMLTMLFESSTPMDRAALADTVGLSAGSGTFDTYLSRLVSRGLVDRVGPGVYTVAEVFRR